MGGSTLELVFLAIFGLVTLFQFVRNYLRGKAAKARQAQGMRDALDAQDAQAGAASPPSATPLPTEWGRTVEEAAVEVGPPAPLSRQGASHAPPAPHVGSVPYARRRVRRFSRAALMGDRHAVQDAVVIAAILRPCHAHKPYGVDG